MKQNLKFSDEECVEL